jgi:hypothetical protein
VLVFMIERTKDELVALGPPNKLPIGAVRTPAELVEHAPLIERGFFDDGPQGRLPGRPFPGLAWTSLDPVTTASADEVLAGWTPVTAGATS